MRNKVIAILVGYLAVGGIIFATQWGLSAIFSPDCPGVVQYTLLEKNFPRRDDIAVLENARRGIKDPPLLWRVVLQSVGWLPDFYQQMLTGDMRMRNYALGGYLCTEHKSLEHR